MKVWKSACMGLLLTFAAVGVLPAETQGLAPGVERVSPAATRPGYPQTLPIIVVLVKSDTCDPMTFSIRIGATVKWINEDPRSHTLEGFGLTEELPPGGTLLLRFTKAGMYPYRCAMNAEMGGVIVVEQPDE